METKRKNILRKPENGYDRLSECERGAMGAYCEGYKAYLNASRTERECVEESVRLAREQGFRPFVRGMNLKTGDKIYVNNRGKMLLSAVIGRQSLTEGVQIAAAHIDSPRLDLKPTPLYEDMDLAYLKTHYYGGLRKYQWTAMPLELHGVAVLRDGSAVKLAIGAGAGEPRLTVSDLPPHLSREQDQKALPDGVSGEQLNLLAGSEPATGGDGERVKLQIMKLLYEKYGFTEDDFVSAELEAIPAIAACDVGLDGSLIGSYGQDDRVCGYAALRALLDLDDIPSKTAICVLADKEETGSNGVTGMQSAAFDAFLEDLCENWNVPVRACLENSLCISADVTPAYDPNFASVYEKQNCSLLNHGVALCKHNGRGGKRVSSDASAEVLARVQGLLDQNGVLWQSAEWGKVDAGGAGTVAKFMADRNIDTLDAGVPLLAMHAPFEISAKLDCYMTYQAMRAVLQEPPHT